MEKIKLWYIPLDMGDWEQDVNMISLEAEGALLKLTFKLWKAPEKGRLIFAFSSLSLLLKKPIDQTRKIIQELHENDVLDIEFLPNDMVRFESRRMLREAEKSMILSQNGSKGGRPKKQTKTKSKAKGKQKESKPITLTITNDSNSDSSNLDLPGGVSQWILFDQEFCAGIRSRYSITQSDFDHMLEQFELSRVEKSIVYETTKEAKAGFTKWVNSWIKNEKTRGSGVHTIKGENRYPSDHPDGKMQPNQIMTNGEEALIDAVLSRKIKIQ